MFSLFYYDITISAFKLFECQNFGDSSFDESRLKSDYSINCKSSSYLTWLLVFAVPIIIFISISYPLYVEYNLVKL